MKLTDKRAIKALKDGKRLRSEVLKDGWFLCLGCCHEDIVVANEDNGAMYPMKLDFEILAAKDWEVMR